MLGGVAFIHSSWEKFAYVPNKCRSEVHTHDTAIKRIKAGEEVTARQEGDVFVTR